MNVTRTIEAAGRRLAWVSLTGSLLAPAAFAAPPEPASPAAAPPQASGGKVDPRDATVLIRVASSLRRGRGSGFVIGDGGWVVTAYHVVAADFGKGRMTPEGTILVLSPWTGHWYEAQLRAYDQETDMALLRLEVKGLPALPLDGLDQTDPAALTARWKNADLRLTGFPAELGIDATAEQTAASLAPTGLVEMGLRGKASVCFLKPCAGLQAGWSGGAVTRNDTGAAIGVFHSVYRPRQSPDTAYPAASLLFQLAPLLRAAGAGDQPLTSPPAATIARAADAPERVARQIRSMTQAAAGRWQKVEAEQQENLRLEPDYAGARFLLGLARAAEGDLDGAVREFREADSRRPDSVLLPLHIALALQKKGDAAAAEPEFRRALSRFPRESEASVGLGRALTDLDRLDEAEKVLKEARDASPNHPSVRHQLGQVYLRRDRWKDALKELQVAVDLTGLQDAFLPMRVAYARALEGEKRFVEAEREYRTVTRRDPMNGEAHFRLANLYSKLGRLPEARLELERLKKTTYDPAFNLGLREIEEKLKNQKTK